MKNRISHTNLDELSIEISYPDCFDDKSSEVIERKYETDNYLGNGYYKEIFFEGVHIGFGDIQLAKTTLIDFYSDFETIEMHFSFSDTVAESDGFDSKIAFEPNQHNLIYINGFKGTAEWPSHMPVKVFEVNLLPQFFLKYLPNHKSFEIFKKEISCQKSGLLSPHNLPITPQMTLLIKKIMDCGRKGIFKKMFLEAHIIELLMLQMEQMLEYDHRNRTLKKPDVDKLYEVKEIISNNIDKPCSLIGLAHEVGTNEFTLKKGFKELFGTTVFGYWNELKMERAQNMLAEEGLTISEVSEKVGYKNPQHFSTAFKRKFGFSPSELKGQV